jgi:WD40 repeat protein/serine/threonine protein kinase/tetratricopeptide (TPR) repeat protein
MNPVSKAFSAGPDGLSRATAATRSEDPRVAQALEEYLAALEAGMPPDRQTFLARHAPIADALADCLKGLEFVQAAAPHLDADDADDPAAADCFGEHCTPGTLGDFRILREIGRGSMGIVYEAEQISLGRRVALKVLPFASTLDAKQLQRFKNEAQAAAGLHHTNIVPVHATGCERGVHFYAMQYIEGQTLATVIDELRGIAKPQASGVDPTGPYLPESPNVTPPVAGLSTERSIRSPAHFQMVARLGVQAAEALEYAHQLGIVHRDIKPANLLVEGEPGASATGVRLWITDFGLAHCQGQVGLTMTGDLVGTLRYMSPEQALAKRVIVDHRTDVYSLGVTLYELLTLEPAFNGRDRQELLRQIAFEEPRAPRRLNSGIPPELETIVLKAVAKNPDERYATAKEFAEDLGRFLRDEPIRAKRPNLLQRTHKWLRRHPAVVRAGLVVLLLTVVVLIGSNLSISRAIKQKDAALGEKDQALTERDDALKEAQDNLTEAHKQEKLAKQESQRAADQQKIAEGKELLARRRFYAAQVNLAYQAWEAGEGARVLELLESQRPRPGEEDLRGFEWYHLWRRCHSGRRWVVHRDGGTVLAFSLDGKTLASGSAHGTLKFWDVATGQARTTLRELGGPISALAYSPDGKTLAVGISSGDVWLWDVATTQKRTHLQAKVAIWSLAFSPDGKRLACGHTSSARLWELETPRLEATLPMHEGQFDEVTVAFSPDGKTLACCGLTSYPIRSIRLWDVATRRERSTLAASGVAAYRPDGKTVAAGGIWDPVQLLDVATGKPWPMRWKSTLATTLAFSPDGQALAVASTKRSVLLWDLKSGNERTLQSHFSRIHSLAFSPDGNLLASASEDGAIEMWALMPLDEPVPLQELGAWLKHLNRETVEAVKQGLDQVLSAAYSSDGKLVTVGGTIWDTATHKEIRSFVGEGKFAFSPDGKILARASDDTAIRLWDVATGKELPSLTPGLKLNPLAFSPDGKTFASGGSGGVLALWDTATWQERSRIPIATSWLAALAYSPDGAILAAGGGGRVQLFDPVSGQERLAIQAVSDTASASNIWSLAFSPDSRLLAVGDAQGNGGLWDPRTGRLLISLRGHTDVVETIAFSPDGKTVVTASHDGTVRIWDVATGQERATLKGRAQRVLCAAIAPDGNSLVSGGNDGSVLLWRAATDAAATARKTDLDPDDPDSPAALIRQGETLRSAGRLEEAEQVYGQALSRLEKLTAAFSNESEYRKLLADTHLGLGRVHADSKQWEVAAVDFGRAAEVRPDNVGIRYWQALARVGALDLDALIRRGEWLRSGGRFQEAEQVYRQALSRLEKLTAAFPNESEYQKQLADTHVALGSVHGDSKQWEEAAAEFGRAAEGRPDNVEIRYWQALAQAGAGDLAGYRGACAAVLDRFGASDSSDVLHWVAWVSVLAPGAATDRHIQIAEKALHEDAQNGRYSTTLGAVLYRAGRFAEAVERLNEASAAWEKATTKPTLYSAAYIWFFLAMAQQRLGHANEARQWLDKAINWMDQETQQKGLPWNRQLTLQILRREAEALLKYPAGARTNEKSQ